MKDPCEMCLVKACCRIRDTLMWWGYGCDIHELFRMWKSLLNNCDDFNEFLVHLTKKYGNSRMKDVKGR